MKKTIEIIFTVISLALLLIPIIFFDREGGKVSATEKRKLAAPPTAAVGTEEFKTQLTDYFNDNIGLREKMLKVRAYTMLKGMNLMPTDKVEKGKDGYYFYTPENNIDIAKGTYPLDEKMLRDIAKAQQAISDSYKAKGKSYVLVLTPSKTAIYPEYLYGDYSVRETPVDIVYSYLKENTDVTVINVKDKLLENKDKGQLFWKQDTHWTQLGAYYAYLAIAEGMNEAGITDITPVEVSPSTEDFHGELSTTIGVRGMLGIETADAIEFPETTRLRATGDFCKQLNAICRANGVGTSSEYAARVFENDSKKDAPVLLMLTDSQFMTKRKLPNLLAESFSQTVLLRLREVNAEMDSLVDPDIVLFSCSERMISRGLISAIPGGIEAELPQLPLAEMKKPVGNSGVCVDKYNGESRINDDPIVLDRTADIQTLSGWAIDTDEKTAVSAMYVKVGDRVFTCKYGNERPGVVTRYGSDGYLASGFTVTLDSSLFFDGDGKLYDSIEFYTVSGDESRLYGPAVYKLE